MDRIFISLLSSEIISELTTEIPEALLIHPSELFIRKIDE